MNMYDVVCGSGKDKEHTDEIYEIGTGPVLLGLNTSTWNYIGMEETNKDVT